MPPRFHAMVFRSSVTLILLRLTIGICLLMGATYGFSFDARNAIARAEALLKTGDLVLARSYLAPALIDPRLSSSERAHAYYTRGFSFQKERLFVSAAADYHRALEFDANNATVISALASLHVDGLGADALPTVARELLLHAAEAGVVEAQTLLGYLSLRGIGTHADLAVAREWFEKAAAAGSARAMLEIAHTYRRPWTDPPDAAAALSWLERAAAAGLPRALTIAGYMAERGEFGKPDLPRARSFFEQAAAADEGLAAAKLAHFLLDGTAGPRDSQRAFKLFHIAAAQDLPAGFSGLAYLYDAGIGTRQDANRARHWRERAAEAGDIAAQRHLAIDARARGDSAALARWLSLAAGQQDPWALNAYAWMLSTTHGRSSRDGTRALRYAQHAVALKRSASHLDTLAAASAEAGHYDAAVEFQREALRLISQETDSPEARAALKVEFEARLASYQQGRPWREPAT